MTIYEQTATGIWSVDSPLSDYYEEDLPLQIGHRDLVQDPIQQRMFVILLAVTAALLIFALLILPGLLRNNQAQISENVAPQAEAAVVENVVSGIGIGGLSPVFSPEVQHWAPQIIEWSAAYNLDPNIVATIMQIESCGDPQAGSSAGAQGLFQVMPFHFSTGENMLDPQTNAARGLAYYVERLEQTAGDVGLAFAGYNGGHVAAGTTWDNWANETQRYFTWSTGIYEEASTGLTESTTLQEWLAAGGASLCDQAANQLGLQ
ncbi:MAG: transglycosylase SLT domain-containing protein [Anaerolineales bacterium]|nr:transglycosylase SLT domain-containing protein [Anaerolineales bacterium]